MGVADGVADRREQAKPLVDRQAMGVTVLGDRHAVDVLHREVRLSRVAHAAVEQACDVRMVEAREDLTLRSEPPIDLVGVHPALDELERDALLELAVRPLRQIHGAHATAPELPDNAIWANENAGHQLRVLVGVAHQERRGELRRGRFQEAHSPARDENRLDVGAQRRVAGARFVEVAGAISDWHVQQRVDEWLDSLPLLGGEGAHWKRPLIWAGPRRSDPRTACQCGLASTCGDRGSTSVSSGTPT